MPSIFRTWTYQKAVDALTLSYEVLCGEESLKANYEYAERANHWQEGRGFPIPSTLHEGVKQKLLAVIEPQFRPRDVINEVLDNVANGLLDNEADVSFVAIDPVADADSAEAKQQAAEIATMVSKVSVWWDREQLWEQCRKATRRSRWAGRGALRIWPAAAAFVTTKTGDTETATLRTDMPFDQALAAVRLMAPTPQTGFVYTDPDTQAKCGVFFFNVGRAPNPIVKKVDLWFVEDGKTVLRQLTEGSDLAAEGSMQIGGRLPIAEMTADVLITDAIRRQQKTLNYFETLIVRVVESAGFPERYTANAMPAGVWLDTPPTDGPPIEVREVEGRKWYMHEVPRQLGPMVTNNLVGVTTVSGDGKTSTLATPTITIKDPTDPAYLIATSDHGRETILQGCKQGHLAIDGAESSGNAYVQARAIYGKDLNATGAPLAMMITSTIETAIATAESLGRTPDGGSFLSKYRCVVTLHVDTGPAVPLEMTEYRAQYKDGLRSRASAMAACGVEDTAAEIASVDTDPIYLATLRTAQGAAMASLQLGGAGFFGSAQAVGMTLDEATALQRTDKDTITVTP